MSYFLSMSQGLEGWYDATHLLLFFSMTKSPAASVVGERNDAKTCHGIATGKN